MSVKFDRQDLERLKELLCSARRIVMTCHMSPDGDALGSTLAMRSLLKAMGKDARVVTPDEPPRTLRVLPGARQVMAWSSFGQVAESTVNRADLIICMDYNALSRLSRLENVVRNAPAPRVLIDHHKNPEDMAMLTFSYPDMSSTCELTCHLLTAMGWGEYIDNEVATCLLGGIITDTGGFHYNSNSSDLYRVVATLMERGVDKDRLMRCLVDTRSASSMRLEAYALEQKMELFADAHAALITLSRNELNSYEYRKGDTEGLVNRPLEIPGIAYSCYMREEEEYIKISMRSIGDFPVDLLCSRHYGGGGHLNAAGGEFHGTLQQAARIFRENLEENKKLISPQTLEYADRLTTPPASTSIKE